MTASTDPLRRFPALIIALTLAATLVAPDTRAQDGPAKVVEAESHLDEIDALREQIVLLEESSGKFEGDDLAALERQIMDKKLEALGHLYDAADLLLEAEADGDAADETRARVERWMESLPGGIRRHLDAAVDNVTALHRERKDAAPSELLDLELRIGQADERVDRMITSYLDMLVMREKLGMPSKEEERWFEETVTARADFVSQRIQIILEAGERLAARAEQMPDDADVRAELEANEARLEANVKALRTCVRAMKATGLEATEYQQLLLEATGEITADILDTEVAAGLVRRWLDDAKTWLAENGSVIIRSLKSSKLRISKLLEDMITSMVSRVILLFGLLVALSQVGVSLGPVLAGLGVAGFIIGFALQDSLSNFAAGVMILFYRPFDMDDLVEVAGVFGKVSRMTLVSTTILTIDNQTLVVPNAKIWGDVIKNVTAQQKRRVDLTFGVSYTDDVEKVERVLREIVSGHDKVLDDPEPQIRLHELADSSVNFVVRPWVKTDDYWEVHWDLTREVKTRFDAEGITIPFPQRDLHVYGSGGEAPAS